jgi:AcrR family transcriptional regulator
LNKKEIQTNRMLQYFVDATAQIIEEQGIENVTIRKIGDKAGYNSATIYNYFEEVSHLIFFAAMRFLKKYTYDLSIYMAKGTNPLEKYVLGWECFCKYSFKEPQIFHAIFLSNIGGKPEELLKHYYSIYQTDLIDLPEDLKPIILEHNLSKRSRSVLEKSVEEGYIKKENVEAINEMTILIWQGMLTTILNNRSSYTPEEASERTMNYIREITSNANSFKF